MRHLQTATVVLAALLAASCHSVFLQTAKIRNGTSYASGLVKSTSAGGFNLHDYSLYLRAEKGAAADLKHFGTSLALNLLFPVTVRTADYTPTDAEPRTASIPNGEVGLFPELKVQMPRNQPVDMAFALRFQNFVPERLAYLVSYDLKDKAGKAPKYTFYGNSALTFAGGFYIGLGTEFVLSPRYSVVVEYTQWLTEFKYKEGFMDDDVMTRPFSLGAAFVITPPQSQ